MAKISSINIIDSTCNRPWEVAVKPFRVSDQIYYVGNAWVGAYLIDTTEGLILLDTTTAETAYLLIDSIYQLGYDPRDIKLILVSHAHIDHDGAASLIQGLSGAPIYLSAEDDAFRFTEASKCVGLNFDFKPYPYEVQAYYSDDAPIVLGNVEIRTKLTPGHTPGTTSFFIKAPDKDGNMIVSAMHGGVGVLTMSDEIFRQSGLSPELRRQFIRDCKTLEQEHVDICLPSHPAHAPFFVHCSESWENGNPFIDQCAWVNFLRDRVRYAEDMENSSNKK